MKKEYQKKWRSEHPEEVKEYQRRWRAKNPKYAKEYLRRWRKKNPDYDKEWQKKTGSAKASMLLKRQKGRELIDKVKSAYGCLNPDCQWYGEVPIFALEFHHIDNKDFDIGCSTYRSRKSLICEMRKCTVLCAICHRVVTHSNQQIELSKCSIDDNGEVMP